MEKRGGELYTNVSVLNLQERIPSQSCVRSSNKVSVGKGISASFLMT